MAYKLHISDLKLNQFSETEIKYIESLIFSKIDKKGKEVSQYKRLLRKKGIVFTPEELVRQLYIYQLHSKYDYPYSKVEAECSVSFGREKREQMLLFLIKQGRVFPI